MSQSVDVDLWTWELDVDPSTLAHLQALLDDTERARAARFVHERHQHRFAAGRGRLREILGRYLNVPAADVAFAYGDHGKPELAAAGTPMVIAYDFNWLSRQILKRMMLSDTATLVNLVSETRVVPECLGDECRPDLIAQNLAQVLKSPGQQDKAMALTMQRLGQGGEVPGLRAARAVLDGL